MITNSKYDGTDKVVISDGTGLIVMHISSIPLKNPAKSFTLSNLLCVPTIQKNLICSCLYQK